VSIGVAIAPAGTNADSAVYTAKRRGGNGSHFADVAG
jgi:GGDEF domain-containing protein